MRVETLHKAFSEPQQGLTGVLVEAHHDDIAQFRMTRHLISRGVNLKVVTLTRSDQRNLADFTPEELDPERWLEGIAQNQLAGVSEMHRISLPDGELTDHVSTAAEFLDEMAQGADFFIAPHILDMHPDHRAAHEVALKVAGTSRAVYGMDTSTGLDVHGDLLVPNRYVVLSTNEARREKRMYRANRSQVENLPGDERRDIFNVLGMTRRRGEQFGVPHAAVIFDPINTKVDPLGDAIALKTIK